MKLLALLYRDGRLYYHNPCHIEFTNQYRYLQSKENVVNDENNISIPFVFVAIGAIKKVIDDSSENYFPPKQLENIYIERCILLINMFHPTPPPDLPKKLEVADIGLKIIQKSNTPKYMAVKLHVLTDLFLKQIG